MSNAHLDNLRQAYRNAVENWVAAIRQEEALATSNHSIQARDLWKEAGFVEEDARKEALKAKLRYQIELDALKHEFQRLDR